VPATAHADPARRFLVETRQSSMSEVRGRWQRVGPAPHCVYYDHSTKLAWCDQE
jgi:hypothetical protein